MVSGQSGSVVAHGVERLGEMIGVGRLERCVVGRGGEYRHVVVN